tara:strand:- start:1094 stop:1291 length:198 start_codon:yes stop_codon:yes gene_type:complete
MYSGCAVQEQSAVGEKVKQISEIESLNTEISKVIKASGDISQLSKSRILGNRRNVYHVYVTMGIF